MLYQGLISDHHTCGYWACITAASTSSPHLLKTYEICSIWTFHTIGSKEKCLNGYGVYMNSLKDLVLSHNSFDSFEGSPKMLLNSSLYLLDLRSNAFQGSLPIISWKLKLMLASNNSFTGEIPLSLCNQSYLDVLDLSYNNFSGSIPRCLITSSVEYMVLRNNNLIGRLPYIFNKSGLLRELDVSP